MTLYREQQRGPPNKDQNALGPLHHRFGSQPWPTPGAQPPKRRGRGAPTPWAASPGRHVCGVL